LGRAPWWYAAAEGRLDDVKRALKGGADVNAADKAGIPALHVAIQNGHRAVVAHLINAGADVNQPDSHGNAAMWVALREASSPRADADRIAIAQAVLAAGGDPDRVNRHGTTARFWMDNSPNRGLIFPG
jgi:ankyrin repeat protein